MNDLNGLFVEISKEIDCLPLREKQVVEEAIEKFIAIRGKCNIEVVRKFGAY